MKLVFICGSRRKYLIIVSESIVRRRKDGKEKSVFTAHTLCAISCLHVIYSLACWSLNKWFVPCIWSKNKCKYLQFPLDGVNNFVRVEHISVGFCSLYYYSSPNLNDCAHRNSGTKSVATARPFLDNSRNSLFFVGFTEFANWLLRIGRRMFGVMNGPY